MKKSKIQDLDPEALLDPAPSSSDDENSASDSEPDVLAGREHYADISKSKLKKKEVVPLGPQYTGSKISREQAEDEDSDDPFARPYDVDAEDSDDSDGNEVDGVEDEILKRSKLKSVGFGDDSEDDEDEEDDDELREMMAGEGSDEDMFSGDDDEDEDDEDNEDDDEENDDEDSDASDASDAEVAGTSKQFSKLMNDDTTAVAATISQAAKADVEKGEAIKTQRKTFDSILNSRIRLQKALISTNSMAAEAHRSSTPDATAISAAETAALTLLNNLTTLRTTLDSSHAGQKRKRTAPFTSTTPSPEIWSTLQSSDSASLPHRNATLEKWSTKTRSASLANQKSTLSTSATQTLTSVLASTLSNPTRLIAKTRIPRSCAPLQSSTNIQSDEHIYDDADFYGLLLKELLEARSSSLSNTGVAEFVVQAPWQVAREAKTRKVVDTKASKGRKMRYTVHEKLQNFMAVEERGSWGERQREELFGSLFGRRVGLGEEVEEEEGESDGDDREEEGLVLFRS
ncbi:TRAUB-domain-containing protein [Amniculicola lignicola CBS 123094]|uniref:Protein BFR2 n=1 Tax=Amniculicola lignicola CBS 123094 TaxID=1392246 RepID=A0A6A5WNN7_9PLEO|nr:TRAUB-domain-containing protein [Amniculicola lignicola CBS 123094]